jgi:hypothetical protein
MKKGLTELVFILDKSGSMGGLKRTHHRRLQFHARETEGRPGRVPHYNGTFDNDYELLHDRIDIRAVSPITEKEYAVGGSTASAGRHRRTIHKSATHR